MTTLLSPPPVEVAVQILAFSPPTVLPAAPIQVIVSPRAGSLTRVSRVLVDPADGTVLPVATPTLTMGFIVLTGDLESIGVDIQYAPDDGISAPITVSQDVDVLAMGTPASITITDTLSGRYWWRARVVFNGIQMPWTDTWRFTVDTTAGDTVIPVTATVAGAASTDPHLWFVDPAGGAPGDTVTVVGQGLPTAPGTVTVDGLPMSVVSWGQVAATPNAATADRTITPGLVDPEHDEIAVIIPDDIQEPGGPVMVEG